MRHKTLKFIYLGLMLLVSVSSVNAQSFGFGCLGLSGFYGGYTQQTYNADGINEFVKLNYSGPRSSNDLEFKQGTGYRIGANLFRADFEDVFLTVKGFFQFMKEEHEIDDDLTQGVLKNKYSLSMNHWGIGLDFGFPVLRFVDFKLLEGGVTFYSSDFTYYVMLDDVQQSEVKLSPDKVQVGYYVGSGFIVHLIRDYISIEGTAAYTLLEINKMQDSNGSSIPTLNSNNRPIKKGGIAATIQINVGFPL